MGIVGAGGEVDPFTWIEGVVVEFLRSVFIADIAPALIADGNVSWGKIGGNLPSGGVPRILEEGEQGNTIDGRIQG